MHDYPALRTLLTANTLLPDERLELNQLLGRVTRLEMVYADAVRLIDALPKSKKGSR